MDEEAACAERTLWEIRAVVHRVNELALGLVALREVEAPLFLVSGGLLSSPSPAGLPSVSYVRCLPLSVP